MSQHYSLEQQVQILQDENRMLREELARIEERAEAAKQAKARLLRGGLRVLLPLLDRQKVARNFAKLTGTMSDFAGPRSRWPTREQVLADAREFMTSCVRFVIRRRMFLLIFGLIAATVPALQLWLVFKQNVIIENQNKFFEIQVYDIVSRSMTEGDRNARQMTSALLANAELKFLQGAVAEAFDAGLLGVYREGDLDAATRRLEDAAFRGNLVRAVVRGVEPRSRKNVVEIHELYVTARPMFRQILEDTAFRLPQVLRLGRERFQIDGALVEQVDNYLAQIGEMLRVYSRLARMAGKESVFYADVKLFFDRIGGQRDLDQNRFGATYRTMMQEFLFDLAAAPKLGAPLVNLEAKGLTPETALQQGVARLRAGLGEDALGWQSFEEQVKLK
jgi:hypothetical protein